MARLLEQSPLATSLGSATGSSLVMNEQDRPRSRFGAMSGWVRSTPLSRMPTVTPRPVALSCVAEFAPTIAISHWQPASGSLLGVAYTPPNRLAQIPAACPEGIAAVLLGLACAPGAIIKTTAPAKAGPNPRARNIHPHSEIVLRDRDHSRKLPGREDETGTPRTGTGVGLLSGPLGRRSGRSTRPGPISRTMS